MLLHAQLCFAILERAGAINLVQALEMIQTFIYLFSARMAKHFYEESFSCIYGRLKRNYCAHFGLHFSHSWTLLE